MGNPLLTEKLLGQQFRRGLEDNDTWIKLYQEHYGLSFKNIYEMATAMELSSTESKMMVTVKVNTSDD